MKLWKTTKSKKLTADELEAALKQDIEAVYKKYDTGTAEYLMIAEVIALDVFKSFNGEFQKRLEQK